MHFLKRSPCSFCPPVLNLPSQAVQSKCSSHHSPPSCDPQGIPSSFQHCLCGLALYPLTLGSLSPKTCSSLCTLIQLLGKAARKQALPRPHPRKYTTATAVQEPVCLLGNHILLNYNRQTPLFFIVLLSHFSTTGCGILHVAPLMSSVPDCWPGTAAS